MQDWLAARSHASPDAVALIAGDNQWTYAELNTHVANLCARLVAMGVQPGDMIGVLMPNCFEYVCLIHATARLNAILIPLNTRLTATEIDWQLTHTGSKLLIATRALEKTVAGLTFSGITLLYERDLAATREDASSYLDGQIELASPYAIVFTSGTSGHPKGVLLTYSNFFYSAMASAYRLGVLPNDRWLCILPLYHVGGLSVILRSCLYGTAVDLHNGFDVATLNHTLSTQPITLISLVPTMLHRLLEVRGDAQWSDTLRLVLLGGAAASPELIRRCQKENVPVATTYGLTEAASQVATALPQEVIHKPSSVGKPLLFTSVRIVDENGCEKPWGEYGEIVVSGPTVMQGYFNNDEATGLKSAELYTGDIGCLDEDGDLRVIQRRSDLIVSGGENVYPAEVESILKQHPGVKTVCVVGIDDEEWGQKVAAAIVLHNGAALTAPEVFTYSRQHLAGYKQPRLVRFVDSLPQTASGKTHRPAVVELLSS